MQTLSPATARLDIVIEELIRISPRRRGCCEPLHSTPHGTQGTGLNARHTTSHRKTGKRGSERVMMVILGMRPGKFRQVTAKGRPPRPQVLHPAAKSFSGRITRRRSSLSLKK